MAAAAHCASDACPHFLPRVPLVTLLGCLGEIRPQVPGGLSGHLVRRMLQDAPRRRSRRMCHPAQAGRRETRRRSLGLFRTHIDAPMPHTAPRRPLETRGTKRRQDWFSRSGWGPLPVWGGGSLPFDGLTRNSKSIQRNILAELVISSLLFRVLREGGREGMHDSHQGIRSSEPDPPPPPHPTPSRLTPPPHPIRALINLTPSSRIHQRIVAMLSNMQHFGCKAGMFKNGGLAVLPFIYRVVYLYNMHVHALSKRATPSLPTP